MRSRRSRACSRAPLSLLCCALLLASLAGCDPRGAEHTADAPEWDTFLAKGKKRYSEGREEVIIRHFFRNRPGGFFLDVGAAHFRRRSTTFYLEEHLGWSGIAIDALEHWGPAYETKRPRTKFLTYIVTDHSGAEEPFYRVKKDIGSTALKDRAERIQAVGLPYEEVRVPTITLDDLLDRDGVTKIDFVSMDIEQGEPAALAGFDIERFAPELVCIEALPEVQAQILEYFAKHGYRRIERYLEYDGRNWYYTPAR